MIFKKPFMIWKRNQDMKNELNFSEDKKSSFKFEINVRF